MKLFSSSSTSASAALTVRARIRAAALGKWADRLQEALHDGLLSIEQWQRAIAWVSAALAKARKRLASFASLAYLREEASLSFHQFSAEQAALVTNLRESGGIATNIERDILAGVILDASLAEAQDAAYLSRYLSRYMSRYLGKYMAAAC